MQVKILFSCLLLSLTFLPLNAQPSQQATVPVTATVSTDFVGITLEWPAPAPANLLIQRRTKGQSGFQWTTLLNEANSTTTTLSDNNVAPGLSYEYYIRRTSGNIAAHGYVLVAVEAPPVHSRGKLILWIDEAIATPLAPELERLRDDLAGDGWQIIEHLAGASATVQSVKDQIKIDYTADPSNVKAVFLLGKIPVPYSGNSAWDGHIPDHEGAWPCDVYYAELNGNWTDESINNTVPSRDANDNVPGDGKFDQSGIPSPVELQIGRVDFQRLSEGTFGATTVELLRRYLDKNHNWRTGAYTVDNKAIVDDNFGYFGGEAFAASGYRNAYPLVGAANVVQGDFFNDTNPQTWLMGYGCGGGSYNSASGVGNSTNFATDTVNIVFSNIFGSYHGDWDYEVNPFMPSALASRGGILTCGWAGRPHHFYQALAAGENIGYCMKETHNALYNNGYFASNAGEGGAHTALLGDPTLRAHIVAPVSALNAAAACGKVQLNWTAPADTAITGYFVYRATERHGAYTLLTTDALTETTFTDDTPGEGQVFYQVKPVKSQTSPGGGIYWNTGTGVIMAVEVPAFVPISITIGSLLDCDFNGEIKAVVSGGTPPYQYLWSNGDTTDTSIFMPGVLIALTVTDANSCTETFDNIIITQPQPLSVNADIIDASAPGASDGSIIMSVTGGTPPLDYLWSNGATTKNLLNVPPGEYAVTITDANGCTAVKTYIILTTSSAEAATVFKRLSLSPNPAAGQATLELQLLRPAALRLSLRDASGRAVWEIPENTVQETRVRIDAQGLASGAYTLFIFVDNQVFVRKLILI